MNFKFLFCVFFLAFVGVSIHAQSFCDDLLLSYHFEENSYDYSGNSHHGIFNADYGTDVHGNENSAARFNGIDQYVDFPNNIALKPDLPVTLSCWVKFDDVDPTNTVILTTDFTMNSHSGVWINTSSTGKMAVNIGDNMGNTSSPNRRTKIGTTSLEAERWYFVVAVVNGLNNMELYIDGQNDGGTYSGTGSSLGYSNDPGSVGRKHSWLNGPVWYYQGLIDEVNYWERALTEAEVEQLYLLDGKVNCIDCQPSFHVETIEACDSYTWIDGVEYTESNNSAQYIYENGGVNGCDSIVSLDLTIKPIYNEDSVLTCTPYTWSVNNETYTQSGVYYETLTTDSGCDSTLVLNLIIDCNLYGYVTVTNNNGANCDGAAEAMVFGGEPPYSFAYSNGDTIPSVQNLCSGVYTLEITDSNVGSYSTTFVISDITIDYTNDTDHFDYLDSLYTSAVEECGLDLDQPVDWFYLDIDNIIWLDINLIETTWYVHQNGETFIFTTVYYITEDVIGDFAYTLTIFCEDESRSTVKAVNFTYKSGSTATVPTVTNKQEVKLYPNPTQGTFRIEVTPDLLGKTVVLTNTLGKVIQTNELMKTSIDYDIQHLQNGTYFIQIQTEEGSLTKKLIKN